MYEVIPTKDTWKLRNVLSNRDVVTGISREAALRLKKQLERNLATRIEMLNSQKEEAATFSLRGGSQLRTKTN